MQNKKSITFWQEKLYLVPYKKTKWKSQRCTEEEEDDWESRDAYFIEHSYTNKK
jgi:hypothetical protein